MSSTGADDVPVYNHARHLIFKCVTSRRFIRREEATVARRFIFPLEQTSKLDLCSCTQRLLLVSYSKLLYDFFYSFINMSLTSDLSVTE